MVRAWAVPYCIRRVPTCDIVGQVSGRSTRSCSLLKPHRSAKVPALPLVLSSQFLFPISYFLFPKEACFEVDPADATPPHSLKKRTRHRFPAPSCIRHRKRFQGHSGPAPPVRMHDATAFSMDIPQPRFRSTSLGAIPRKKGVRATRVRESVASAHLNWICPCDRHRARRT